MVAGQGGVSVPAGRGGDVVSSERDVWGGGLSVLWDASMLVLVEDYVVVVVVKLFSDGFAAGVSRCGGPEFVVGVEVTKDESAVWFEEMGDGGCVTLCA